MRRLMIFLWWELVILLYFYVTLMHLAFHCFVPFYICTTFNDAYSSFPIVKNLSSIGYYDGYFTSLYFQSTGQWLNLLIDTGSSNAAVVCAKSDSVAAAGDTSSMHGHGFEVYRSNSVRYLGKNATVTYISGWWSGALVNDYVSLDGTSKTLFRMDFACIEEAEKIFLPQSQWQGILGLAYRAIISPDDASVEAPLDSMTRQLGNADVFEINLCGISDFSGDFGDSIGENFRGRGEITFGAEPAPNYNETTMFIPLYRKWFYDVVVSSVSVDHKRIAVSCEDLNGQKAIIDTGTTFVHFPRRVFNNLISVFSEMMDISAKFFNGTSELCWAIGFDPPWDEWPTLSIDLQQSDASNIRVDLPPEIYLRVVPSASIFEKCYRFGITQSEKQGNDSK